MEGSNLQHTGWTINNQRHSYGIKNVGRQWPLGAWMWRSIPASDKWYSYCWLLGYNCCLRWLLKYRSLLNIFNVQQWILHPNMTTIRTIYSTLAYNRVRDSSDQSRLRIGSDWNEHSMDSNIARYMRWKNWDAYDGHCIWSILLCKGLEMEVLKGGTERMVSGAYSISFSLILASDLMGARCTWQNIRNTIGYVYLLDKLKQVFNLKDPFLTFNHGSKGLCTLYVKSSLGVLIIYQLHKVDTNLNWPIFTEFELAPQRCKKQSSLSSSRHRSNYIPCFSCWIWNTPIPQSREPPQP